MRDHGKELVGGLRNPSLLFSHDTSLSLRLKVLKDEIKKPYFITLKQFLWQEGVRGPDDNAENLKIYPARKFTPNLRVH